MCEGKIGALVPPRRRRRVVAVPIEECSRRGGRQTVASLALERAGLQQLATGGRGRRRRRLTARVVIDAVERRAVGRNVAIIAAAAVCRLVALCKFVRLGAVNRLNVLSEARRIGVAFIALLNCNWPSFCVERSSWRKQEFKERKKHIINDG